jgi:DNA-binding MarR family transcriptional regulator
MKDRKQPAKQARKQPAKRPRASSPAATSPVTTMSSFLEAAHLLHARMEEALGAVDLSPAKYAALDQLLQAGGPVPLRVLSQGQHCVPSNMTQLMDRLEAEGLVRRLADPADRRIVLAELTKLGSQRAIAGGKVIAKVQADFAKAVSKSDGAALDRLVQAIRPSAGGQ